MCSCDENNFNSFSRELWRDLFYTENGVRIKIVCQGIQKNIFAYSLQMTCLLMIKNSVIKAYHCIRYIISIKLMSYKEMFM